MDQKDKDILKKGLEETTPDFTSRVMNQINAEEKALSNVLSKHGAMETSPDFTAELMAKLEGKKPAVPYTPVISKTVWMGLAAMLVGVIIFVFASGSSQPSTLQVSENLQNVTNDIGTFFTKGSAFMYILLGTLVLSIALVVEQRLSRK